MPFPQRQVEPIFLAKNFTTVENKNSVIDFVDIDISILNNVIQQLSSISDHAFDMFQDITKQCDDITSRTESLSNRVDAVSKEVEKYPVTTKVDAKIIEDNVRGFEEPDGQLFTKNNRPSTISGK